KILVLNCGSSSVKYKLMDMPKGKILAQGGVEKIGIKGSFLKLTLPNGEKVVLERELEEHQKALEMIFEVMTGKEYGCISSLDEIDAVGHRVVHGGEKFNKSVLIDKEVIRNIKACVDLAPLHNPSNLKGMEVVSQLMGNVPQIAVFDTAFHQTMPSKAFLYGLPY
ncbi:MAG TPA: acetate kinase, partial [Porphyromonadaceae bacterium]|nr:acetate kinase [Porphyromonadaceae bacterium]